MSDSQSNYDRAGLIVDAALEASVDRSDDDHEVIAAAQVLATLAVAEAIGHLCSEIANQHPA